MIKCIDGERIIPLRDAYQNFSCVMKLFMDDISDVILTKVGKPYLRISKIRQDSDLDVLKKTSGVIYDGFTSYPDDPKEKIFSKWIIKETEDKYIIMQFSVFINKQYKLERFLLSSSYLSEDVSFSENEDVIEVFIKGQPIDNNFESEKNIDASKNHEIKCYCDRFWDIVRSVPDDHRILKMYKI